MNDDQYENEDDDDNDNDLNDNDDIVVESGDNDDAITPDLLATMACPCEVSLGIG